MTTPRDRVAGEPLEGYHLWRCKQCSAVYTEMPLKRRCQVENCGGRVVPFKTPKEGFRRQMKGEDSLARQTSKISQGAKNLSFLPMIKTVLEAADGLNYAAVKADSITESLRKRNLAAGEEYVDEAEFDLGLFNLRAWLVLDMLTLKGMLQAAGLEQFIRPALLRLLDLRLKPATDEPRVRAALPPQVEQRLSKLEQEVKAKPQPSAPELPRRRKKTSIRPRG